MLGYASVKFSKGNEEQGSVAGSVHKRPQIVPIECALND